MATAGCALASLSTGFLHAQDDSASLPVAGSSWVHESWTVKDGLPVNSINGIVQDQAGYIWAATFDGLVRFDGVRFTVYNSSNAPELPSNRIVTLRVGRDGTLWMATEQAHLVRFQNGHFTNIPLEGGRPQTQPPTLLVDSLGEVWMGRGDGLWTVRGNRAVHVALAALHVPVTAIVRRRDGSIWVGTEKAGIFRVRDGSAEHITTDASIENDFVGSLFEDAAGTMWIGANHGVWSLTDRLVRVNATPAIARTQSVIQIPATRALYIETGEQSYSLDGTTATLVPGVLSVDGKRIWSDSTTLWRVRDGKLLRGNEVVFALPAGRFISAYLFDREGSLWLGMQAGGLHRLKRALFTTFSTPEGLTSTNVYSTFVDHAGIVWLGTWGGGVSRLDPRSGRATSFAHAQLPLSINAFYEDAAQRLWVGGGFGDGRLYVCAPPTMACHREGVEAIGERAVFALHGDGRGRLWVGAAGALASFDGATWTHYSSDSGAPEATVRAFASASDGSVWMGTNGGGIARFLNGRFLRITRADGLPSDLVRSLFADGDSVLWIGTEGRGLARLDVRSLGRPGEKPRIVRIGTSDGLFDDVIHQILEDNAGRLWMNTNRGVFWATRAELDAFASGKTTRVHTTAYTERDGMRNREGNGGVQPAGAKGRDGRLWFPTQDGVVVVDPSQVRREQRAPPLVVERIVAAGETLPRQDSTVQLLPSQRDLQIDYTALTFLQPSNVRFRYRLEPYDAAWVDAGTRRTAFYTKVPPGHYRFAVQASDALGGWYAPTAHLDVRVVPQLWETALFRWLAVVTLGILVFVAIRVREARLHARALRLERLVEERTSALRESERALADRNERLQSLDHAKTRFFANVSHELRTPLTLTIGPLEDLRARVAGDAQAERWLDIALRNARRLLRLVNQILDVAKLEAGAMPLVTRRMDAAPLVRGVVAAFAPVAERKHLRLTTHYADSLSGAFDADALEKIVTNLLSNAIKFTPDGGSIEVTLTGESTSLHLVVRDSGPGIPADQLPHVFERFYQVDESTTRAQLGTGIGLSLVKELVELHGGTIVAESGSSGTTFHATIPSREVTAEHTGEQSVQARDTEVLEQLLAAEDALAPNGVPGERAPNDEPALLIVDDNADLRAYVRDHFSSRFRVIEAGDGAAGIEAAQRHLPDVILSDVMMPGTDGHELVRVLRSSPETDFLSIVLLTAQAEPHQKLQGLERGADDYIVKPFEMRELDVRVRNLIASRRRLRERFAQASAPRFDAPADAPIEDAYAAKVRAAIRDRLSDPDFGVGELAEAVAQDRSHLFRRVKQVFGESPSDLIRRMRIEQGERLLADNTATVTDVAYAVGFNSLSYFCRCFQEVYGVTPAAYRESQQTSRDAR